MSPSDDGFEWADLRPGSLLFFKGKTSVRAGESKLRIFLGFDEDRRAYGYFPLTGAGETGIWQLAQDTSQYRVVWRAP